MRLLGLIAPWMQIGASTLGLIELAAQLADFDARPQPKLPRGPAVGLGRVQ
jgi:hypothetical protein